MNDQAWEKMYDAYYIRVYSFTMTLCGDQNLAEDVTQETFSKKKTKSNSFRNESDEVTWLCAIARNLFLDEKRRQTRTEQMPEEIPSKEKTPEQLTMDRDSSFRIHMALHALDEPYREAFELRVFGELSFREIGTIFGKTENWARVTYHRARLKLQERMNADEN